MLSHLVQVVHLDHHAAEDVSSEGEGLLFEQLVGATEGELERNAQRLARHHRERPYERADGDVHQHIGATVARRVAIDEHKRTDEDDGHVAEKLRRRRELPDLLDALKRPLGWREAHQYYRAEDTKSAPQRAADV